MTERLRLEYESAQPFPGRHAVRPAHLVMGGERVPVVVKLVRSDWRQRLRRQSKAERSLEVARALLARGIDTPEPLAIEIHDDESLFVARRLVGACQIREWFLHRDDPRRHPAPSLPIPIADVIQALGRLARRMHDQGVFYRDLSDGNVLVTGSPEGFRLWLVDLDRARVGDRPVGLFARLRDLSRPGLNRVEDRRLLLRSYQGGQPAGAVLTWLLHAFRRRLVLWDELKRRARPWKRRS